MPASLLNGETLLIKHTIKVSTKGSQSSNVTRRLLIMPRRDFVILAQDAALVVFGLLERCRSIRQFGRLSILLWLL
jgi:hypothetical protein